MNVEMIDADDVARENRRRARKERIRRLDEEFHSLMHQNELIFDKWRREGILPPEEPRRRF